MSETSTDFVLTEQTSGAFVKDVDMATILENVADELRADEALLAVAVTGAKAPERPWDNPDLVASLQSLIASGRATSGVSLELLADYDAVVGSGEDSLVALSERLRHLAATARDAVTNHDSAISEQAQNALLEAAEGFWDKRAAKRLAKYATVLKTPDNGVYDRPTCVTALDAALVRVVAARDLYERLSNHVADQEQAQQEEEEVMAIEEAELDAEQFDVAEASVSVGSTYDFADEFDVNDIDELDLADNVLDEEDAEVVEVEIVD